LKLFLSVFLVGGGGEAAKRSVGGVFAFYAQ
jgi:hypothetical protein